MTVRGAEVLGLAEVRVLRLQPGDDIVLRLRGKSLPDGGVADLIEQAEARWPGHKVTVLHGDLEIEVVRSS